MLLYLRILLLILIFNIVIKPQNSLLYKNVEMISSFIASEDFKDLQHNFSDLQLIDSLYKYSLKLKDNDAAEALLVLTFGTIPYRSVPVKLPLFLIKIDIPLISVCDSVFKKKVEQTPKKILIDSPQNDFGDKDKLAHFFGNAFLSYHSFLFEFTNLFGYFVEAFEETFQISRIDERDLLVNKLGQIFGKMLKNDPSILPSKIFLDYNFKFFRVHI